MKKLLCRLLGHDLMTTSARRRTCLRCGLRETLRQYGSTTAWGEGVSGRDPRPAPAESRAPGPVSG